MEDAAPVREHVRARAESPAFDGRSDMDARSDVCALLERAGVDLNTPAGAELRQQVLEQAWLWADKMEAAEAPLNVSSAVVLGARSVAADLMGAGQLEALGPAEQLALRLYEACAEADTTAQAATRRRWGEGATPRVGRPSSSLLRLRSLLGDAH